MAARFRPSKKFVGILFFLLIAVIAATNVALFWYRNPFSRVVVWLATVGLTILLVAVIGLGVNRRPAGAIIDSRNRVSLSKLQMIAWTILVLSALMTAGVSNLFDLFGGTNLRSLLIDIPPELLAAMGIAAVSLTATPAILSMKDSQPAGSAALQSTAGKLGLTADQVSTSGQVFGRTSADDASWVDIFRGDEVGNAASPDLSKIQQFLITLLLLAIYGGDIWSMFASEATFHALPLLDDKFVWLMGISHASYLTYKAAPHSSGQISDPTQTAAG